MEKFDLLVNWMEKIQVVTGILSLVLIISIIPLQVFCRYVLNAPLVWAEDVATGLLVWLTFLGAAVLYKRKGLVTLDFFLKFFTKKLSFYISVILDIMIALLCLIIIIYGYQLNTIQMAYDSVGTGFPRALSYSLPLLINVIMIFLYSIHAILREIISMVHS